MDILSVWKLKDHPVIFQSFNHRTALQSILQSCVVISSHAIPRLFFIFSFQQPKSSILQMEIPRLHLHLNLQSNQRWKIRWILFLIPYRSPAAVMLEVHHKRQVWRKSKKYVHLVFCFQNCSDILWKNILVNWMQE